VPDLVKGGIKHQERVMRNNLRIMGIHLLLRIIKRGNKQNDKEEEDPKLI
jgi:hypothetical protein